MHSCCLCRLMKPAPHKFIQNFISLTHFSFLEIAKRMCKTQTKSRRLIWNFISHFSLHIYQCTPENPKESIVFHKFTNDFNTFHATKLIASQVSCISDWCSKINRSVVRLETISIFNYLPMICTIASSPCKLCKVFQLSYC